MSTLGTLRKLVLGETWTLPLGIALSVALGGALRLLSGAHSWWRSGGGAVLLVGLLLTLAVSLRAARRPPG